MVISSINSINNTLNYGVGARNAIKAATSICPSPVSFGSQTSVQKFLSAISQNFSSQHQRAILGVTALCTQPFIDLYNPHIKKDDKPVTVARTIAKILVGTTVGVILRRYAIKAIKNYTNAVKCGKYSQCLLPKKIVAQLNSNPDLVPSDYLTNYRNGMGTFIGTMGGLFTNFLVDAPLSKKLTNFIHEKIFLKEGSNAG